MAGLPPGGVLQARVSYVASCGCRSAASDLSEWASLQFGACGAPQWANGHPEAPTAVPPRAAPQAPQAPQAKLSATSAPAAWPSWLPYKETPGADGAAPPAAPYAVPGLVELLGAPALQAPAPAPAPLALAPMLDRAACGPCDGYCGPCGAGAWPSWRCVHGGVVPQPPIPELLPAGEQGFALLIQWPSVDCAAAYVVELTNPGSNATERFLRAAPATAAGSVVELRVGGLQPGSCRSYAASVRCVAHCGCESSPSPIGRSQPMMAQQMLLRDHAPQPQPPPEQGLFQPPPWAHQPQLREVPLPQATYAPTTCEERPACFRVSPDFAVRVSPD